MINKRLEQIAYLISKEDLVLDLGCDHGYLAIYLKKNNMCKSIIASDVSSNALNFAKSNFEKYHVDINAYLSDGLLNIPEEINTLIISGMGTHSIINILNYHKLPNKMILSSNNEYYLLRKFMNKLGYKLVQEKIVCEHNKYYSIMEYIKGYEKISYRDKLYGKSNDNKYYKYLYEKNISLIKKVPFNRKLKLKIENILLLKKINESTERK